MKLDFFIVVSLSGVLAAYLHLVMEQWDNRIGMVRLDFSRVMVDACCDEPKTLSYQILQTSTIGADGGQSLNHVSFNKYL